MKYTVIATYEAAVDIEVEAESEDKAIEEANKMIAGGAISDEAILESLEPGEVYVLI